jgi:hypothetical protein
LGSETYSQAFPPPFWNNLSLRRGKKTCEILAGRHGDIEKRNAGDLGKKWDLKPIYLGHWETNMGIELLFLGAMSGRPKKVSVSDFQVWKLSSPPNMAISDKPKMMR